MKIEGACHCGAIAYEGEVDPNAVSICHCADCQTLSGAPFRASVPVRRENFKITRGAPTHYVKVAESGNQRAQGFCAACGTPIYSTTVDAAPPVYMLRAGAIKQRDALIPKKQIWHKSALPWAQHVADLESLPGNLPSVAATK